MAVTDPVYGNTVVIPKSTAGVEVEPVNPACDSPMSNPELRVAAASSLNEKETVFVAKSPIEILAKAR